MTGSEESEHAAAVLPLRHRIPEYLMIFGLGWLGIIVVGLAAGAVTQVSAIEGVAYAAMVGGAGLMMVGGTSGGGYTDLGVGAAETLLGLGRRDDADREAYATAPERRPDPMERLKRGRRPEKNPRAFWQVIAGVAYLAAGLSVFALWAL